MSDQKSRRAWRRWLVALPLILILAGGARWLTHPRYVINEISAAKIRAGQSRAEVEQILGGPPRAEGGLKPEPEEMVVTFGYGMDYSDESGFRYHYFHVNDRKFWDRHPQHTGPWSSEYWASPRVFVHATFDNRDRVAEVQTLRWRREPATWLDRALSWIAG